MTIMGTLTIIMQMNEGIDMLHMVRDKVRQKIKEIKEIMYSTRTVAFAVAATAVPGSILTFTASIYYGQTPQGPPLVNAGTQCQVVLRSPIASDKPVFLAQGWEKCNGLANGMLVRAFVDVGGESELVDGIQLADGRIWVNGQAFDRTGPPKQ